MKYSSKLRGVRNTLGINQKTMSKKLGITIARYSLKETGKFDFKKSEIDKIMEITGKKYEELF